MALLALLVSVVGGCYTAGPDSVLDLLYDSSTCVSIDYSNSMRLLMYLVLF